MPSKFSEIQSPVAQLKVRTVPFGVLFAIVTALFFGTSTPLAKHFLTEVQPFLLSGLMYLGGGLGLIPIYFLRNRIQRPATLLKSEDWRCLLGSMVSGGMLAPISLMMGLEHTSASVASLLLNFESVFTALVAWSIFREPWHWRVLMGIAVITAGGILVSHSAQSSVDLSWGALAILGTCLAWAIDSNFTAKIAHRDPIQLAIFKSGGAGLINTAIASSIGQPWPSASVTLQVFGAGFIGYGLTYCAFVMALRYIGASRTGAFFALSPLVGVAISIVFLGEPFSTTLVIATMLMVLGATLCAWEPSTI
jgi:drug/metabolite transporter (DMT)-like permease